MKQSRPLSPLEGMICKLCGTFSDTLLCNGCMEDLKASSFASRYKQRCERCNRPILDRAYPCHFCREGLEAFAPYAHPLSTLIRLYKRDRVRSLAPVLADLYTPMLTTIPKPLLVPVPASRKGVGQRGFDQMLLITTAIKRRRGYPVANLFCQKGRTQNKFLNKEERKTHQTIHLRQKAHAISRFRDRGYTFVLLDDICTTGSTLGSCQRSLEQGYGIEALSLVLALL